MVMTAPPWIAAVRALDPDHAARRILLSPQGRRLEERVVRELAAADRLLLLCGRYEGVDERVIELVVDEELSIGDYVLAGGEVAALVVIEALSRQIPGVVGLAESVERDSFRCGWLDHPHYTRPREVEGSAVPPILLSGDHARIERWRRLEALRATLRKRPDLIGGIEREGLDAEERRILAERVKELSGRSGSS
jgi:tRNA (guanine37-N1)-methyltransferase